MSPRRRRRRKGHVSLSRATGIELLGALLIAVGLWQVYYPLAWIWAGLVAFAASYLIEWRSQQHEPDGRDRRAADRTPIDHDLSGLP